ncbi:MAG: thioredoxin family protein [Acetobacteraceae bacterium]|nr:thioredoxin family protein [Acetobacteraceae bacterium]
MPFTRRHALSGLAIAAIAASGPARAAERAAFSDAAFDAAQAAGRPILIDVFAPWCPVCRAQKPHIDATLADPALRGALFLTVDFDSQKDALRRLNVQRQSTLIAFRGREERGRATGITDGAEIRALLMRAL